MKKRILLHALFMIFVITNSFAQLYEISLNQRIKESELIFEGEVIRTKSYWSPNKQTIFTSNIVKIVTLFKGTIEKDEVEIITEGGFAENKYVIISHNLALEKTDKGLFFCIPTNKPQETTNHMNKYEVFTGVQGFIKFTNNEYNTPASDPFHTYENIERQLYQLVEKQVGQKRKQINLTASQLKLQEWLNQNNIFDINVGTGAKYSFDNPQITGTFPQYLEFDILTATSANTYDVGSADIYIDYSVSAFGSNIVANAKIVGNKETVILSSDYTLALSDETTSKLKITIDANLSPTNLYNLTTVPEKICHLKIDISNLSTLPDIFFDETMMQGHTDHYNGSIYVPCSFVIADDSINTAWLQLVPPIINSISPMTVTAGTHTLIEIKGINFGNVPGAVQFRDADVNMGYSRAVGPDYAIWTDTLIQVYVPSQSANPAFTRPAGTGEIIVINSAGESSVRSPILTVDYGIINLRTTFDSTAYRGVLIDSDSTDAVDGYIFTYNPTFSANADAKNMFEGALKLWRCNTLVNFTLNANDSAISPYNNSDHINSVKWSAAGDGFVLGALAKTVYTLTFCIANNGDFIAYVPEIDMILKDDPLIWHMNTTALPPAGTFDLFSVILHELGHAQMLTHVIDVGTLMHYNTASGSVSATRTIPNNQLAAGISVITASAIDNGGTFSNCTQPMIPINPLDCNTLAIENETQTLNEIVIRPNPFIDAINISFELNNASNVFVSITDIFGKEVYHSTIAKYPKGKQDIELDLPKLSTGIYIVSVNADTKSIYHKIIKY